MSSEPTQPQTSADDTPVTDTASGKYPNSPIATGQERSRWFVGVGTAMAMLMLGGVSHGLLSNRWGVPEDIVALGNKLSEIPKEVGPWKCSSESQLDKTTEKLLETKGYISRVYTHESTGESVNVFVVFGPKGPIAVHTPEVCYKAQAVTQTSERSPVTVESEGKEGNLWKLGFETNSIDKRKMSVYYGWTEGGPWQAAQSPRFWRTDYLYKIQTSCQATGKKEDSTDEFFKFFLPELRKYLRTVEN